MAVCSAAWRAPGTAAGSTPDAAMASPVIVHHVPCVCSRRTGIANGLYPR